MKLKHPYPRDVNEPTDYEEPLFTGPSSADVSLFIDVKRLSVKYNY